MHWKLPQISVYDNEYIQESSTYNIPGSAHNVHTALGRWRSWEGDINHSPVTVSHVSVGLT